MLFTGHRHFSGFCPDMKGILLELIRDTYTPLLQLPPRLPEESWMLAVGKADPVFFYLYDGVGQLQIGEASRESLLQCLKQELGEPE
ncbi:hypothetical protein LGH70_21825 [Hymenobacter sp. BT635]|uniref:Uncharacterized protein n=1 Tax=Hymenobacter nitidus TaxID=2880929 RepID=A0ABS8AIX2_9BACT|nr:hypothetical protein [Hymenobacter nitidus]MCB2380245.1 hypothetical protein [Hymenobacter nitidus]